MHHRLKFQGELHGATQVHQGCQHEMHHFQSTLILRGNTEECHPALGHFISESEFIHESATVKMGERNTSRSLHHWWKCAVSQQHTCGVLVFMQHV
jgi:hypothetical protein